MTFTELRQANQARCEESFHAVDHWQPWEWTNAMAGECGEACNITKKMLRMYPAKLPVTEWNKPEDRRMEELEERLAAEIADVVIYADLAAARIGRSLDDIIRQVFNAKSEEIGSPIRL